MNNKFQWLEDAKKAMNEFADTDIAKLTEKQMLRKENASYAASCVTIESRIKKGKIAGAKNVETGHIQRLNDYPRAENQRTEAGKKAGAKNVETGWAKEFQRIGTAKAIEKLMVKKLNEIKVLYNIMESNKLYSHADLSNIVTHVKSRRLFNLVRFEEAKPYIEIQKNGQLTFYKKIETKFN